MSGEGKVKLVRGYIWIDKGKLMFLQRWWANPREFTRQLSKILVGKKNLVKMFARERSKKKMPVPEDIV